MLLLVALAGSLISAVSSNVALTVLGRALQGLCSAVIPLSIDVVREAIAPQRVLVAVGLLTSAQVAGVASGY